MAHAFNGHSFGLLLDAERLYAGAVEHQQRLAEVVTVLEATQEPSGAVDLDVVTVTPTLGVGAAAARLGAQTELAITMRQLLSTAEEQQRLAATVLTRLVGARVSVNGTRTQRVCVLIVDDSEDTRETTAAILEEAGFDAVTAANGLEGVIAAHYALPAVVLMDLTMPVLNGVEAARLLRESPLTQALKVIAFTARPDVHERAVARSFSDILSKPAMPEAIVAAVRRFVTPDGLAPPVRNNLDAE
jgi:CheY-like chemotaxis protein